MNDSVFDLVSVKHSLASHEKENTICNKIVERLKNMPNVQLLKHDVELTLYVCNLIESAYNKKYVDNKKVDKKEMCIRILTLVHCLKPDEQPIIDKQIDFLYNNAKIKATSIFKKVRVYAMDWLNRRLL